MEKIGALIKAVVDEKGMSYAEFARRINKSPQNVSDLFKRKTTDIEFLETIGQALDYDFFKHYIKRPSETGQANIQDSKGFYGKKSVAVTVHLDGSEVELNRWKRMLTELNRVVREQG